MARLSVLARLLAVGSAARAAVAFHCYSDVRLGEVASAGSKGIAIDDNTMHGCPSKIPWVWPNTMQPVTSLRFFKAWRKDWPEEDRLPSWRKFADYVMTNNAKVLMGAQTTCDEEDDNQDWEWVKEFLGMLQPHQIMGVAVGNELELLWQKTAEGAVTADCIDRLWSGGGYWYQLQRRARDLDAMGFGGVPLTAVFTGTALGGYPFLEDPHQALVTSFLRNATDAYGRRFVFTFNFYPYFDPSFVLDPNSLVSCNRSIEQATCWNTGNCNVPATTTSARAKMLQLTGRTDYKLWIGETGWSAPIASTLHTAMASCTEWSSMETFRKFYTGFLSWNLAIGRDRAPEHVFFFTARDSLNFGVQESFGLIDTCVANVCKIRSADYKAPRVGEDPDRLDWMRWAFVSVGGLVLLFVAASCLYVKCGARAGSGSRTPRRLEEEI